MKSCFVIRRDGGSSLFISPFVDTTGAKTWSDEEEIVCYASTPLNTHEKDNALFTLYTQIDRGVDRWIQDARYIPRLLVGATVFLITYFFFSLAIRDPLPVIDELIIAGVLSFIVVVQMGKRDKKSDMAMKRRMELKQHASRTDFDLLEGLGAYESYVNQCMYIDTIDLADRLAMTGDADLPELEVPEEQKGPWQSLFAKELLVHVQVNNPKLYGKYLKVIELRNTKKGDDALSAKLLKLAMHKEIDLAYLALLVAVTNQK